MGHPWPIVAFFVHSGCDCRPLGCSVGVLPSNGRSFAEISPDDRPRVGRSIASFRLVKRTSSPGFCAEQCLISPRFCQVMDTWDIGEKSELIEYLESSSRTAVDRRLVDQATKVENAGVMSRKGGSATLLPITSADAARSGPGRNRNHRSGEEHEQTKAKTKEDHRAELAAGGGATHEPGTRPGTEAAR